MNRFIECSIRSMFLAQRSQLDTEESTGSIDKTKGSLSCEINTSRTKSVRTENDKIERKLS